MFLGRIDLKRTPRARLRTELIFKEKRSCVRPNPQSAFSFLDRYLTVWIFAAMALGLVLGTVFTGLPAALDGLSVGPTNVRSRSDSSDDVSAAGQGALRGTPSGSLPTST